MAAWTNSLTVARRMSDRRTAKKGLEKAMQIIDRAGDYVWDSWPMYVAHKQLADIKANLEVRP